MIPELNEQIVKFTPKQMNVQVKLSDFMQVTRIRIKMLVTFGNVTDQIKFYSFFTNELFDINCTAAFCDMTYDIFLTKPFSSTINSFCNHNLPHTLTES